MIIFFHQKLSKSGIIHLDNFFLIFLLQYVAMAFLVAQKRLRRRLVAYGVKERFVYFLISSK